jgi:hypothetical protein
MFTISGEEMLLNERSGAYQMPGKVFVVQSCIQFPIVSCLISNIKKYEAEHSDYFSAVHSGFKTYRS